MPDHAIAKFSTFEDLPTEILSHVTSFLPASPLLRLRRCSKTLASRIIINQTFWRDKLISGHLIPYLWDLKPQQCRQYDLANTQLDWKKLAQRLTFVKPVENSQHLDWESTDSKDWYEWGFGRAEVVMAYMPMGLINRYRIAMIVRDLETLDKIEAQDPTVVEEGELARPHRMSLAGWKKAAQGSRFA